MADGASVLNTDTLVVSDDNLKVTRELPRSDSHGVKFQEVICYLSLRLQ